MFSGSYAWGNFTILALGVWAVAQRDSIDAIGMVSWGGGTVPIRPSHPTLFCSKALHMASLARPPTQQSTSAVVLPRTDMGAGHRTQWLLRRAAKGFPLVFLQWKQMVWTPRDSLSEILETGPS